MVRTLQFAPSKIFPLERTCKYTQTFSIYRWGQTQIHHSSRLELMEVGSDNHSYLEIKIVLMIVM